MSRSRLLPLSVLILSVLFLRLPAGGAETLRILTPKLALCGSLEKGRPTGFCFELANEVAREAGLEPVNTIEPLARVVDGLLSGDVDMALLASGEDVVSRAERLGEIKSVRVAVWARAGTPLRNPRDLAGKPVAVVRCGRFESKARDLRMVPISTRSYEQSLKLLMVDRVAAVVGPVTALASAAGKLGLDRRALGEPLMLGEVPLHLLVSKTLDKDVADRLRAAWRRVRDNGVLAGLVEKYKL